MTSVDTATASNPGHPSQLAATADIETPCGLLEDTRQRCARGM
jgi:hypothetical protein